MTDKPIIVASLPDSLQQRISICPCGCWLWTGADTGKGPQRSYGKVWWDKAWRSAHIVVYEFFHGRVPDGHHLDHTCRVRKCVNPFHLEPVTPRVNTLRGNAILFKKGIQ